MSADTCLIFIHPGLALSNLIRLPGHPFCNSSGYENSRVFSYAHGPQFRAWLLATAESNAHETDHETDHVADSHAEQPAYAWLQSLVQTLSHL
jgi:predicted esterase